MQARKPQMFSLPLDPSMSWSILPEVRIASVERALFQCECRGGMSALLGTARQPIEESEYAINRRETRSSRKSNGGSAVGGTGRSSCSFRSIAVDWEARHRYRGVCVRAYTPVTTACLGHACDQADVSRSCVLPVACCWKRWPSPQRIQASDHGRGRRGDQGIPMGAE